MTEMDVYRGLGRAVAKRRKELALTQADVAEQIGLTRASLANIETGRQKVLLHQVYRLASALKLKSIIDLIPPSFSFDEALPHRLSFSGSRATPDEQVQLEELIALALGNARKDGRS
jgi:transcriptional regulator with XRE-family HTH domain